MVESFPDTKSIVLGTFIPLSPDEEKILDSLILSGLGIGINHEQLITAKTATATSTVSVPECISEYSKSNNSGILSNDKPTICIKNKPTSDRDTSGQKLMAEKVDVSGLQLILHRLCVQPGERINETPKLLDSIPTTSYNRSTMRWIQDNTQHYEATEEYSTDSTIDYWDSASPKLRKKRKHLLKRKNLPSAKSRTPRSSGSFNFKVSVHGI